MFFLNEVNQYIKNHILRKQEQVEWLDSENPQLLEGYIVRRTTRTYRRLAKLWVAKEIPQESQTIDKILADHKLSRKKLKDLQADSQMIRKWLIKGYVIRKVMLSKDGHTPTKEGYVMGPALFCSIQQEKRLKIQREIETFMELQEELRQCTIPENLHRCFRQQINRLLSLDYDAFKQYEHFNDWSIQKRMFFLQFLIALFTIKERKSTYDFKEIGAFYFKRIGGSKVFDRYKDDFINQLEKWLHDSPEVLGLTSHGRVHSIYFSGNVEATYSTYRIGSLHAVTDVALSKNRFQTDARVLWLVENRAILTRMAASPSFLEQTASIIICLDGNIRSSHRQFMNQISQSPTIEQVMIWTDYDESGLSIAREAYTILPNNLNVKWIASNGDIYKDYTAYAHWLQKQLPETKREQEEVLGDEKQWKKWINH